MKKSPNPEWMLTNIAIGSMIGTFLAILLVQRELNFTFAIWYLAVVALVVAGNTIYVFYKKKRKGNKRKTKV